MHTSHFVECIHSSVNKLELFPILAVVNSVDPWIAGVWTAEVHLCMDFKNSINTTVLHDPWLVEYADMWAEYKLYVDFQLCRESMLLTVPLPQHCWRVNCNATVDTGEQVFVWAPVFSSFGI